MLLSVNSYGASLEIIDENTVSYVDSDFQTKTISKKEIRRKKNLAKNSILEIKQRIAKIKKNAKRKENRVLNEINRLSSLRDLKKLEIKGYNSVLDELAKYKELNND